jgi:hypothetical protein
MVLATIKITDQFINSISSNLLFSFGVICRAFSYKIVFLSISFTFYISWSSEYAPSRIRQSYRARYSPIYYYLHGVISTQEQWTNIFPGPMHEVFHRITSNFVYAYVRESILKLISLSFLQLHLERWRMPALSIDDSPAYCQYYLSLDKSSLACRL